LKQAVYSISGALGVDRAFAFLNRNRPVVLAFHGVTAEAPGHLCNHEGLHLHRPIFERLMTFIASRYHAVPLSRVVDWLEGSGSLPDRAVAVTFDDGYRDVLTQAGPVLKRLGIPATLFVATDFVFGGEMLWPDRLLSALHLTREPRLSVATTRGALDLPLGGGAEKIAAEGQLLAVLKSLPDPDRIALLDRIVERLGVDEARLATAWPDHAPLVPHELAQLPAFGIEVGSHTCSHAIVTRMSEAQAKRELSESKRLIEAASGRACQHFSYPNGGPADYDARTRQYVVDAGYRSAVTTIKTAVTPLQDPFEIPRCVLAHNRVTLSEFAAEVSGLPRFLRGVKGRLAGRSAAPEGGSWRAHARGGAA
jgi:peptidoglycan/xylan/chitin deacetylase (PgdA/CDA1 family)